ncbi:MAG: hypothetical protein ACOY94_10200 [Bacillota bacterium]
MKRRKLVIGLLAGVILIWSRYVFADITQLLEVAMLRGLHEYRPAGGKAHG